MEEKGKALVGSRRRPSLSVEEEQQLASCIGVLSNLGFSPSRPQMKDLVCDYTRIRELKTPFKDGRPGKNWLRKFMERNKLSMKKANMISAARISATCNPFIVYDFYDTIEGLMTDKQYSAEQAWNFNESGFPTDPSRAKVIAPKGKAANKITWGPGRENISTLAACSASGRVLDPSIIFSGKNFQSTWRGKEALPNACLVFHKTDGWLQKYFRNNIFRNILL